MKALLQFSEVTYEKIISLSFSLAVGEIAVLIELSLGEAIPQQGSIFFREKPVEESTAGEIGWIPSNGGLINNLKVWENITLPLWYHGKRIIDATEKTTERWLLALAPDKNKWADFMACSAAKLEVRDQKLAGLLRGLVLAPKLLVVDAELFDNVNAADSHVWQAALETFVQETTDRAVIIVSKGNTPLHWKIIKEINQVEPT